MPDAAVPEAAVPEAAVSIKDQTVAQWKEVLALKDLPFLIKQTRLRGNGNMHDEALHQVIREKLAVTPDTLALW